jgi:hypothetical protein
MTVRQIIQEIQTLPPQEQGEIKAFFLSQDETTGAVKYADREKALAAADKIFTDRAELFQKLAQ